MLNQVELRLAEMTNNQTRLQPIVAFKALRRLIADPQQTHEVFTIIRALSGPALRNGYMRFASTEIGRTVLREKRSLLATLQDRDTLASLAPDSLGRTYLDWAIAEGLTANDLVEASAEGEFSQLEESIALFGMRQRDMHDLWHTLTQYGRDELGEACLLAFTYAQTKNRGVGVICLAGLAKLAQTYGAGAFRAGWKAYRDGARAKWMPGEDWEALLAQPVDDVRRQLRLTEPASYWQLRAPLPTAAA